MRIGVDASCWSNRRGFGRFARELVTHMVRGHPEHEFTLIVDRQTAEEWRFPDGSRLRVVETREQPTRAASAEGARGLTDILRMGWAASSASFDAFFFPAVYTFYPLFRRVPMLVTFHDAIADTYPELTFPSRRSRALWRLKCWLARRQAARLLTVSESARAELSAALRCPPSAIQVISEAPGPEFRPLTDRKRIEAALARYGIAPRRPLILYVGGISPHKNLHGLLHALCGIRTPSELVIVGDYAQDSFHTCYDELRVLCATLGLEGRVTFTGFVPDEDLVALYNAATLLVLPSLAEGFGLPAVEAMACGLPVAASRRGSLPEVLGNAAVLFDPRDAEDMAAAMDRLLTDAALREHLRAEGLARASRLSWTEAAQRTVGLIEEIARGAP